MGGGWSEWNIYHPRAFFIYQINYNITNVDIVLSKIMAHESVL